MRQNEFGSFWHGRPVGSQTNILTDLNLNFYKNITLSYVNFRTVVKINHKRPGKYKVFGLQWMPTDHMTELPEVCGEKKPEFRFSEFYWALYLFCQKVNTFSRDRMNLGEWALP